MAQNHEAIISLMQQVLGDSYTHFHVQALSIEEDLENQKTTIRCDVVDKATGAQTTIQGVGVGVVDALFNGVTARYGDEYPSLKSIRFASFAIRGRLDTKQAFSGTDSTADAELEIANSEEKIFTFRGSSRSIISSAVAAALSGLEYFINSERAFITLYNALVDAKERNRPDLIQRYTDIMSTLVQNTSYSAFISSHRQKLS